MSESKHTPGPWQVNSGMVETAYDHMCKTPGCGTKIPIAYMDREAGNGTMPVEWDSNARLIAAAPELLAELEGMVKVWKMGWKVDKATYIADAEAAIAKAKGAA